MPKLQPKDEIGALAKSFNKMNNKILVIDDEIAIREGLRQTLERAGYELLLAENGKEGLQLFHDCHPVLIILDLKMPVMCGVEFLEHIKLSPTNPFAIIVLTGYGTDEEVKRCFDLGTSAFLRKPFNVFELMGLVRNTITLKDKEEKLKKYQNHLEELVEERTSGLVESEALTKGILDTAAEGIITINEQGIVLSFNQAAEKIFGYEASEAIGKNVSFLMPSPYRDEHDSYLARYLRTGEKRIIGIGREITGKRKGGKVFPMELAISEVETGKQRFFTGIITDITKRKEIEKELVHARELAEAANLAKSEFLANMSHEIRTPLNGVIGMIELLLSTELTPTQKEYVVTLHQSGEGLLKIINDILDYSKAKAGKLTIEYISFDLKNIVQDLSDLLAVKAEEKGVEFIIRYDPDIEHYLVGDPTRIRQVLANLISNAIKFTHEGYVLISVECKGKTDNETKLRFSVEDTGIGIPEDVLYKVFEKFTQGDTSSTRKYGGTGLGLAISKHLVEMMRGTIGVSSIPGQGSTFWFTLPFSLEKKMPVVAPNVADLDVLRVLVVDDNEVDLCFIQEFVSSWGLHNRGYASGEAALKALREAFESGDPYQVTIINYQMPGMDGLMLGRAIKNDPDLRDTSLVMLTSIGQRASTTQMVQVGFAANLLKPVHQSELMDTLTILCDGRKHNGTTEFITRHTLADYRESGKTYSSPEKKSATQLRVLVVGDNKVSQMVAVGMLEKLGCFVNVATNGMKAVEMVTKFPFDLVFMDSHIPKLNGYKVASEIRRREGKKKHTIIIALTTYARKGERERCLEAGMDDHLSQPIKSENLKKIISLWTLKNQVSKQGRTIGVKELQK